LNTFDSPVASWDIRGVGVFTQGGMGADMNSLTAFGFSGEIGLAYKLNEKISLGLAYTSPTTLNFKNGTAKMDMTAQLNDAFGNAVQGYMMQSPSATPGQAHDLNRKRDA